MKFGKAIFGFLFILSLGYTPSLQAKDTVTWVLNGFIPFYIQDGPYKGQGISDKLTTFFQKRLPDYIHRQEQMTFSRFFALVEKGNLVCNPLLLKTPEREKILAYSRPFKPAYAHVMVSNHKVDTPAQGVSFKKFLEENRHRLIVQTKRSYGPLLDEIIKDARARGRIQDHSFPTKQLYVMLEKERIDYFVDIENSAVYYQKLHPGKRMFHNVALMEDRLDRFGYAVCSKTPAGQRLITIINQIIEKEKGSAEFRSILESWMAEENLARFRSFYDREILGK